MAHVDIDAELAAGEVARPLAAGPCLARIEHALGMAGRDPGGDAGRRRDRRSCSPAWSRATCFHAPLVWSDELASILFLWLAMLGAVVAFRRGEHMRMTALVARAGRSAAGLSRRRSRPARRWRSCC